MMLFFSYAQHIAHLSFCEHFNNPHALLTFLTGAKPESGNRFKSVSVFCVSPRYIKEFREKVIFLFQCQPWQYCNTILLGFIN